MAHLHETLTSETRTRLLEAAGEVFAEFGFRAATIRDICGRAGANVAAVNYHFRDKESLYEEVLRYAHQCASDRYRDSAAPNMAAEERLRLHILNFMRRILDAGRPAWHGKLMAREMVEPTAALDRIVDESIRPQSLRLGGIIRELLGDQADERLVQNVIFSVVGQCMFYRNCQAVIVRLDSGWTIGPDEIEAISEHISRFSLAAIGALKGQSCT